MLRWQANRIRALATPRRVTNLGVVMLDLSLLFALYAPFSGEKPGVYWMSQLALLFGGIICTVEGVRWESEGE